MQARQEQMGCLEKHPICILNTDWARVVLFSERLKGSDFEKQFLQANIHKRLNVVFGGARNDAAQF